MGSWGENFLGASDATANYARGKKSCKSSEQVFQGKIRDTVVSHAADNRSNKMRSEIGLSNWEVIGELDNGGFSGFAAKA